MRKSVTVLLCVLLVATLLSPGVAMAKGGNGRHSESHDGESGESHDRESEKSGDAKAEKSGAAKSDSGKAKTKGTEPKAGSARRSKTAKVADKPTRKAPKAEASRKAEKPQAVAYEQPASAAPRTSVTLGSPVPTPAAEDRISAVTVGATGVETRGVLDTIRLSANAWLRGMRATAAGMWSSVTSWFGA